MEVDYTPQRRHQVGFVRVWARAASALRVLVGVVEVAFRPRRRPGEHARVILTKHAQNTMFSGRMPRFSGRHLASFSGSVRRNLHRSQVGRLMFARTYSYGPRYRVVRRPDARRESRLRGEKPPLAPRPGASVMPSRRWTRNRLALLHTTVRCAGTNHATWVWECPSAKSRIIRLRRTRPAAMGKGSCPFADRPN